MAHSILFKLSLHNSYVGIATGATWLREKWLLGAVFLSFESTTLRDKVSLQILGPCRSWQEVDLDSREDVLQGLQKREQTD